MTNKTKYINKAKAEYNSYNTDEWRRDYFNCDNGGYLVVSKQRIEQGKINKQEQKKYDKEYDMCRTLAQNGHKVEYLKITEGSFDIYLNEIAADLKKTSSHNNIVKDAKWAIKNQKAEIVVFELENETDMIHKEILQLKEKGIHGMYYFTHNKNEIYGF